MTKLGVQAPSLQEDDTHDGKTATFSLPRHDVLYLPELSIRGHVTPCLHRPYTSRPPFTFVYRLHAATAAQKVR